MRYDIKENEGIVDGQGTPSPGARGSSIWAVPTMTVAHLGFAVMPTACILVAIQFEERDPITIHGKDYVRYRREVPMLVPRVPNAKGPGPGIIATDCECA